jgi:hypothetical protein
MRPTGTIGTLVSYAGNVIVATHIPQIEVTWWICNGRLTRGKGKENDQHKANKYAPLSHENLLLWLID